MNNGPVDGSSPGSRVLAGKRVLLCEDEGIILLQLRCAVLQAGLIVCGAESTGEEAVAAAAREEPDILIMDIGLPGDSSRGNNCANPAPPTHVLDSDSHSYKVARVLSAWRCS